MSLSRDILYMQHALALAARGLGQTWPNPTVGAVIVKNDRVMGCGHTARGGRPHAETIALAQTGDEARGATLYVTLEPCAHQGQTPPCTEAIIRAGIVRVVAALKDSNPKVKGKGYAQLRTAGIEVTEGVCEKEARALNGGFFSVHERGRPLVTLKLATSLDGKIATRDGSSKWITNEASRRRGHYLRGSHDAILTGIGTVLADNPRLTCRLPGREQDSPQRVVADTRLRLPEKTAVLPAWIITSKAALKKQARKAKTLEKKGASLFTVSMDKSHVSPEHMLELLAEKGITRLLIESGSALATSFMQKQLVDSIYWFRAPFVIGKTGLAALGGSASPLSKLKRYVLQETERLGDDSLEIYAASPR